MSEQSDNETKPKKNTPSKLGVTVKRLRMMSGISQRKLAAMTGLHHVLISSLESGHRQSADVSTIEKLAKGLKVSVSDIIDPKIPFVVADSPALAEVLGHKQNVAVTPIEPMLAEFLRSSWSTILKPAITEDDVEWLRSLPGLVWINVNPTSEAIYYLIMARRTHSSAAKPR